MRLNLVVLTPGKWEGKAIPVTLSKFIIGRAPDCHLRPASPIISQRHCTLLVRGSQVFVRDCASTNGTFVNDNQVEDELEVQSGDRLRIGPLEFAIRIDPSPAINRPTPMPAKVFDVDPVAALLLALDNKPASVPEAQDPNPVPPPASSRVSPS